MCQGAILWSGIETVVFGSSIRFLQSRGWSQIDITAEEVVRRTHSVDAPSLAVSWSRSAMPFLKWPQGWVTWSRIEHLHENHDCLPSKVRA